MSRLSLTPWALAALLAVGADTPHLQDYPLLRAEALQRRAQYVDARDACKQALAYAQQSRDHAAELAALRRLSLIMEDMADPDANEIATRALQLSQSTHDQSTHALLLVDAANGHWKRGEYREAEALLDAALTDQRERVDRVGETQSLSLRARIAYKIGHYDEALAVFERVLQRHQEQHDLQAQSATQIDIGLVHLDRRSFDKAAAAFRQAGQLARRDGDFVGEFEAEIHTAINWMFQDAPQEARTVLEPLLERARRAREPSLAARAEHILANALRQAGLHHEAIGLYEQAGSAFERQGHVRESAWVLARRARSEFALGRLTDAERSLSRAAESWGPTQERRAHAWALYELGRLQKLQARPADARLTWKLALAEQQAIELPFVSLLLSDLALLEADGGDLVGALSSAEKAVAAANAVNNPEMQWSALFRRARIERKIGRNESARRSLEDSIAIIESMRHAVQPSDEARTGFMESRLAVYDEAVDLLIELGRLEAALEHSERGRARALVEMLESAPLETTTSIDELREVAHRNRMTIVEYVVGERASSVIVLEPSGRLHAHSLALSAAGLAREVAALRQTLSAAQDARPLLSKLYRELVTPIETLLPADPEQLVTIVPHQSLFLVPFACLLDDSGRYLIQSHTLSYAPALRALRLVTRRRESGKVLVVGEPSGGSPLPSARDEAVAIAQLFPAKDVTLLLGGQATEASVRNLAGEARVMHLATHGYVDDSRPLASYLGLTAGPAAAATRSASNDGRLTARELFDIHLNRPLVTLSACNSASGRITGDGVIGLTRGFLSAGASTVVASLWRVADRPAEFQMKRFYQELATSRGLVARSMRQAQLATLEALRQRKLIRTDGTAFAENPLYWAPFVVVGNAG